MGTRVVERVRREEECREEESLLGIVRAVQFGALFWAGLGLLIWLW